MIWISLPSSVSRSYRHGSNEWGSGFICRWVLAFHERRRKQHDLLVLQCLSVRLMRDIGLESKIEMFGHQNSPTWR